jgi:hypothetical protein
MSDGFLGRWAKRKEAVRKGEEVRAEPPQPSPQPSPASGRGSEEPPPPTLEEAQALTPESDFTRFTARNVAPEVKNAAFKKLFADPRFNVMDGLDSHIGDFSQPDPMPPEMLRQLASAKFLKLFDDEEEKPQARESAEGPAGETVAQSEQCTDLPGTAPGPSSTDDADPDLRLQQDHAPGPRGPGQGSS